MKNDILILGLATILLIGGLIISCTDEPNVKKEKTTYQIDSELNKVQIVTIDGCEYLYGPWGNATVLTHKGNCPNPYHYK